MEEAVKDEGIFRSEEIWLMMEHFAFTDLALLVEFEEAQQCLKLQDCRKNRTSELL